MVTQGTPGDQAYIDKYQGKADDALAILDKIGAKFEKFERDNAALTKEFNARNDAAAAAVVAARAQLKTDFDAADAAIVTATEAYNTAMSELELAYDTKSDGTEPTEEEIKVFNDAYMAAEAIFMAA